MSTTSKISDTQIVGAMGRTDGKKVLICDAIVIGCKCVGFIPAYLSHYFSSLHSHACHHVVLPNI